MKRERGREQEEPCTSKVDEETSNPSYHTRKGEMGVTNPSPTKEKNTTARASIEGGKQNSGGASISKQPTLFFLSGKSA